LGIVECKIPGRREREQQKRKERGRKAGEGGKEEGGRGR
jgi:hypothetical protein